MNIQIKNKPVFFINKDFQSILIKVLFPFEENDEELALSVLLPSMFASFSEHFPTEESFQKEKKKRYLLGVSCQRSVIGNNGCFSFQMAIPDVSTLGEDYLSQQFSFLEEVIYHPLLEGEAFVEKEVEREKRNIRTAMDNSKQNLKSYHSTRIREILDDEGVLSRDLIHSPEQLDAITGNDLYHYYQKIILKGKPAIYIMGNVEEKEMTTYCEIHLYHHPFSSYEVKDSLYHFLKPKKDIQRIEEKSTFRDSIITYGYIIQNMKREETIYLSLIHDLLTSSSSRLLQKKLRYENDLVYASKVLSYPHFGVFEVTAYISKEMRKEAEKVFFEVMEDIKKEEIIEPILEKLKRRNHINLLRQLDDKYFLFTDFILKDLGIDDTLEETYQKMNQVHAKDIIKFLDRFQLDTIYYLEEEEHE